MSEHCKHCEQDYDLEYLDFPSHFGPHCDEHRMECEDCGLTFCMYELKECEDGMFRCEECEKEKNEHHPERRQL